MVVHPRTKRVTGYCKRSLDAAAKSECTSTELNNNHDVTLDTSTVLLLVSMCVSCIVDEAIYEIANPKSCFKP